MKKLISVLLFCTAAFTAVPGHSQAVDPSYQIAWPTCAATQAYSPETNTCETVILPAPSGAQIIVQPSLSQPLAVNFMQSSFHNGIVQADQFCGIGTVGGVVSPSCSADACTKLQAANQYAVTNNVAQVDATHFIGTQACNVNPFAGLNSTPNAPVNLAVNFGATHFQNANNVIWLITNSNITLHGMGPWATQVEYVGSSPVSAVVYVNGDQRTGGAWQYFGIQGIHIDGMYFYGDLANVTDGLLLKFVNRSRFDTVYAWGVTGCGIHTEGAVTDTFIQPRVAVADAAMNGIQTGHTQPFDGLCLDGDNGAPGGNEDTTSGSVIDAGMEGVSNAGIHLLSADQETIHGGTSEQNKYGILINTSASGVNNGTSNKFNMFLSMDLESNLLNFNGSDVTDNASLNTFFNILSATPCSSCSSVQLSTTSEDYYTMGYVASSVAGQANGVQTPGVNSTSATAGSATALPATPAGYINEQFQGNTVHIPWYH